MVDNDNRRYACPRCAGGGGGLFHRVILQSGSALNPWALVTQPDVHLARMFTAESAAQFNCSQLATSHEHHHHQQQQLIDCLRQIPVEQLINVHPPQIRLYRLITVVYRFCFSFLGFPHYGFSVVLAVCLLSLRPQ